MRQVPSRPYVVGLTGGIGSGKSTVAELFAGHGIICIDADEISRRLVAPGTAALRQIAGHFGPGALLPDGSLDRKKIRALIFSNEQERHWLEALLHPLIREAINQAISSASAPWVLLVAPLLLENNLEVLCDRVLVVDLPEALQINRTMARDTISEQEVRNIITSQMGRESRLAKADDVIDNSGNQEQLEATVRQLIHYYEEQAGNTHQTG